MTDSARWRKIEEIFHKALERPETERESWLDGNCEGDAELRAEVASLIASDREAGVYVGSKVQRAMVQFGTAIQPQVEGRRLGPYRLIRELGRGGMGSVYLAARDDEQYESDVAIKLVHPGLDTDFILRRFKRERQILARLQHPNIARLFDGGTAEDGTPYLVMEYIQGSWITKFADEKQLSVEERLRLFLPVCAAVEYAHRHFIVHRDLKPGNILIDSTGTPKLLDFGISKLLHATQNDAADTQDLGMMTPAYASPEQIVGDAVTLVSDVYSLGAVLYELLSGMQAHRIDQCTPLALERAICIDETIAPSAVVRNNRPLARRLAGDLDIIILRAMQKEPDRRYPSVEQMAEDIRRHLDHRPILARRDSFAYRAGKFVRRNRITVALGSMVTVSLIAGAGISIHEALIAQERFQDVRKLATTFVFDVEQAVRELPGSMPVRQLIARTGLEYLGNLSRSAANDWSLKRELATAYIRIGELQGGVETSNLGDAVGALKSFHEAQALLDSVLTHSASDRQALLDRMTVSHRLSDLHRQMGQLSLATAATEDGLRRANALLANNPNDADAVQYGAVFHLDLGRLRQQSGDLSQAATEIASGIRLLKQLASVRPDERETLSNIAVSQARLGAIQADLGHREEALESYREGVIRQEELNRRFPNDVHAQRELMLAYSHVGDTLGNPAYDNVGDEAGARAAYSRMVEVARHLHEADPADVRAMGDYGIAQLRLGIVSPPAEKKTILQRAHDFLGRATMRNPQDSSNRMHKAWTEVELGDASLIAGDRAGAVRYYQMAITTLQTTPVANADSASERWFVTAAGKLAAEYVHLRDRAAAESALDKALELASHIERETPPSSVTVRSIAARAWQNAGTAYAMLAEQDQPERNRDVEKARDYYRRSVEEWKRLEPLQGFNVLRKREMDLATSGQAGLEIQTRGTR
jgi:eukaryotic-like serine/threonine-protein kinase